MAGSVKRNVLTALQQHKLNVELDSHRGDYEGLDIGQATERLQSTLQFTLTEHNVDTAAGIVGVTFVAREARNPSPFMIQLKATNDRVAELRTDVGKVIENSVNIEDRMESAKTDINNRMSDWIDRVETRNNKLEKDVEALTTLLDMQANTIAVLGQTVAEQGKTLSEISAFFNRIMAIPIAANGHIGALPKNLPKM